jgi:hypothetical protein
LTKRNRPFDLAYGRHSLNIEVMKNTEPSPPTDAEVIQLRPSAKAGSASKAKAQEAQNEKRRGEAKFGDAVMAHGYTIIPNLLLRAQAHLKVSPSAFNILLQLSMHWWHADEIPFLLKETIADRMGKSPRQIQRYITELEKAGLLKRIERFRGKKAQIENGYSLAGLVAKLKSLEPKFKQEREQKERRRKKVESLSNAS